MRAAGLAGTLALVLAAAAPARADDPYCTQAYGSGDPASPTTLRFGIDPEPAGSAGVSQGTAKPEDLARRDAALAALQPRGQRLVLRVSRLFFSDGDAGISRFQGIVAHDRAAGYDVELQVRYHPSTAQEGDIPAWTAYVRRVVDALGPDVVAMTITNEANVNVSPNTSDGSYRGATDALVAGVIAARDEAVRRGLANLALGFTYAYRFDPRGDAAFWDAVGRGGDAFRGALSFVGVDAYPGSFYPPALAPGQTPGAALVQALATVRGCYMPKASLGTGVPIWLTENGYPTTPGAHSEAEQAAALASMVDAVHEHAATYRVTDYRWFNLRDNDSSGPGMFDTDGLLRDDYSPKPSFAALRARMVAFGYPINAAGPSKPVSGAPRSAPKRARRHTRRKSRHNARRRHHTHRRVRHPRFTG